MPARKPILATDGWHDLPGGGAVQVSNGVPAQVSDKGRWDLDELKLFAEAAEFTCTKLTWVRDRTKRWHHGSLFELLGPSATWCYAKVALAGCDVCGSEVGGQWVRRPGGDESPEWCCTNCAAEVARGGGDE